MLVHMQAEPHRTPVPSGIILAIKAASSSGSVRAPPSSSDSATPPYHAFEAGLSGLSGRAVRSGSSLTHSSLARHATLTAGVIYSCVLYLVPINICF